jgi:N-acetylglucosaminyl-diphospho-decaprenol L-rhamnosyltransferase
MSPSIDVVIPVHGNYELTRSCLAHLAAQTVQHQAIVVDDCSPDDTVLRLGEEWPAVRVVELAVNQGYTRAVNRGVADGNCELVVLLNNDVELRPDFLARVTAPLERDAEIGSVASVMLAPGESLIDSAGVTADPTLAGFARLQGRPAADAAGSVAVLTGPEGTAGAYRRAAWEQVGGLDERIEAYMEILDLALRLRTAGWRTELAPDAIGVHLGSRSYGRGSPRQRRLAGFSRGYLLRRYGTFRDPRVSARAALTELVVVAGDALANRDLQALAGRLAGWRAARGLERRGRPPADAIDQAITFAQSIALRRGAVRCASGSR